MSQTIAVRFASISLSLRAVLVASCGALLVFSVLCIIQRVAAQGGAPEQARSADTFVDTIGVNTHIHHPNQYSDLHQVQDKLTNLGVRHIRDAAHLESDYDTANYQRYRRLAAVGIKTQMIFDLRPGVSGHEQLLEPTADKIRQIAEMAGNSLEAFEGANEYDLIGGEGWANALRLHQQQLYQAVKGNPSTANVPVYGPSLAYTRENSDDLGDLSAYMDGQNLHSYPGGRLPTFDLYQYIQAYALVGGTKPLHATETGYHNATNQGPEHDSGVSDEAAGKYMPRLMLEYFNRGFVRTFQFQLLDTYPNPDRSNAEEHYGLIRNDWTEKPAYTSLKNLINLLNDPGDSFTPQSLAYSLSGDTTNVHHTLLQKRDGRFYLILWQEVPSYVNATQEDISVPAQAVTINLGGSFATAKTYLPYDSSEVIGQFANPTQLALNIPDHPLVVELTPGTPDEQTPYLGAPFALPGTIQAEDFDNGGEGVAYHDLDAANQGGQHRSTGVDIQNTGEAGGGYSVCYAQAGEWLEYTVNVQTAGTYNLRFGVASEGAGGTFHLEANGINKTGQLQVPNTGGWQTYETVTATISLEAGQQVLRLALDTNGATGYVGNFNYLQGRGRGRADIL